MCSGGFCAVRSVVIEHALDSVTPACRIPADLHRHILCHRRWSPLHHISLFATCGTFSLPRLDRPSAIRWSEKATLISHTYIPLRALTAICDMTRCQRKLSLRALRSTWRWKHLAVVFIYQPLVVQVKQLLPCVCVSVYVRTITFEIYDLWARYLACWQGCCCSSWLWTLTSWRWHKLQGRMTATVYSVFWNGIEKLVQLQRQLLSCSPYMGHC